MAGGVGHTGGLTNPAPGVESVKPVLLIPVGLLCLKRGCHCKKDPQKKERKKLTRKDETTKVTQMNKN